MWGNRVPNKHRNASKVRDTVQFVGVVLSIEENNPSLKGANGPVSSSIGADRRNGTICRMVPQTPVYMDVSKETPEASRAFSKSGDVYGISQTFPSQVGTARGMNSTSHRQPRELNSTAKRSISSEELQEHSFPSSTHLHTSSRFTGVTKERTKNHERRGGQEDPPFYGPGETFENSLAHALNGSPVRNSRPLSYTMSTPPAKVFKSPKVSHIPTNTQASDSLQTSILLYPSSDDDDASLGVSGLADTRSLRHSNEESRGNSQKLPQFVASVVDEASASWQTGPIVGASAPTNAVLKTMGSPETVNKMRSLPAELVDKSYHPHRSTIGPITTLDGHKSIILESELLSSPLTVPSSCSSDGEADVENLIQKSQVPDRSKNQNVRTRPTQMTEEPGVVQSSVRRIDPIYVPSSSSSFSPTTPSPSPPITVIRRRFSRPKFKQSKVTRYYLDYVAVPSVSPHPASTLGHSRPLHKLTKGRPLLTGGNIDRARHPAAPQKSSPGSQGVKFGPPRKEKKIFSFDESQEKQYTHKRTHRNTPDSSPISAVGTPSKPISISDSSTEVEIVEVLPLPAPYYDGNEVEPILPFHKTPEWLGPVHCLLRNLSATFPHLHDGLVAATLSQSLATDERFFRDGENLSMYGTYQPKDEGECSIWSLMVDEPDVIESFEHDPDIVELEDSLYESNKPVRAHPPFCPLKRHWEKPSGSTQEVIGLKDLIGEAAGKNRPQSLSRSPPKRPRSAEVVPESDNEDAIVPRLSKAMSAKARGKQKATETPSTPEAYRPLAQPSSPTISSPPAPLISETKAASSFGDFSRIRVYETLLINGLVPKDYPKSSDDLAKLGAQGLRRITNELCGRLATDGAIQFRGFDKDPIIVKTHIDAEIPPIVTHPLPVVGDADPFHPLPSTFEPDPSEYTEFHNHPPADSSYLIPPGVLKPIPEGTAGSSFLSPAPEVLQPIPEGTTAISVDPSLLSGQRGATSSKKATFWNRSKRKSALRDSELHYDENMPETTDNGDDTPHRPKQQTARAPKTKAKAPTQEREQPQKKKAAYPRIQFPKDPEGRSMFCHHCRRTSSLLHMTCLAVCNKSFCQRCLQLKYTGITFDSEADNWTCLVCIDRCGCDQCTRKRGLEYIPGQVTHLEEEEEEEIEPFNPLPAPPTHLSLDKMVYFGTMYGMEGEVIGRGFATNANENDVLVYGECEAIADQPPNWRIRSGSPPVESEKEAKGRAVVGNTRPFAEEPAPVNLLLLTGQNLYVGNKRILNQFHEQLPAPLTIDTDPGTPIDDEAELTPLPDDMENNDIGHLLKGNIGENTRTAGTEQPLTVEDIKSAILHITNRPDTIQDDF